jgi:magnesium transporter
MTATYRPHLDDTLNDVRALLTRHRVLATMARRQASAPAERRDLLETLQQRQNLVELERKLASLHRADLAHILEVLPLDDRRLVWDHIAPGQRGLVLVEVSAPLRRLLLEWLEPDQMSAALAQLDADDLAYLADDLPPSALAAAAARLDSGQQSWLTDSAAYDDRTVGALMSRDAIALQESMSAEDALGQLRTLDALPGHTDRLFVVDSRQVLRGSVPVTRLLVAATTSGLASMMDRDVSSFSVDDDLAAVAKAFERYDLVSAPVVDRRGKLVGRLTANTIIDFVRAEAQRQALATAGLSDEEDLFAPILDSARNRWPWLFVNVVTAFIATRVIGVFAPAIESLVALATLMPVVASIGGNTGNQTIALVVRGLALDQLPTGSTAHLLRKEVTIGAMNGVMWGGVMGLCALALYGSGALAIVMAMAMVLNLLVAAVTGVVVPLALQRAGRDPAQGASVLLTFVTDSMGFLLFLGLATVFLV